MQLSSIYGCSTSGTYLITGAEHYLTSWLDGGQWHTSFNGTLVLQP
ncbi:hypothetical protein [Photorhabdus stackebrandtii]